jgi:phosphoglycolate phosphatase
MPPLTVVFDLDGTLIDTAPDLTAAVNFVLDGLGIRAVPTDLIRADISLGAAEMLRRALRHRGSVLAEAELERLYRDVYLPRYEATIAVGSRPFPGLEAQLVALKALDARLAVCTNKWEGMSRKLLAELAFDHHFDAVAGRDTFPVFKPHPDHLTGAIRMAGGDPRRAVMVGDSKTDIDTARAAGLPVVAVTFGYTDVPVGELGPDAVIDHYDELPAALRRLGAV